LCESCGADKNVFLRLVANISDEFLEQPINIIFCVKLGQNASDNCEVVSAAYGWGGTSYEKVKCL
jgi:hypothetical protein